VFGSPLLQAKAKSLAGAYQARNLTLDLVKIASLSLTFSQVV